MGHKRTFESLEMSPIQSELYIIKEAKTPIESPNRPSNVPTIHNELGLKEKKSKRSLVGVGPLIKSRAFPKSPISSHLKLKELARKKGPFHQSTKQQPNQEHATYKVGRIQEAI